MEQIAIKLALSVTFAMSGATSMNAAEFSPQLSANTQMVQLAHPGIDYDIITGGTNVDKPSGVLKMLDACDADCQAKKLGLTFDK